MRLTPPLMEGSDMLGENGKPHPRAAKRLTPPLMEGSDMLGENGKPHPRAAKAANPSPYGGE